jgi:hypothetical protein
MPDYPEKHDSRPLPAPYLKNKSSGGKGPLGKPDFCSKTRKLVKHLQTMQVTPGCDPGIYGPDKDGVDWAFGSFTETSEMIYRKRTGNERNLSVIWEFNKITHYEQQHPQLHILP